MVYEERLKKYGSFSLEIRAVLKDKDTGVVLQYKMFYKEDIGSTLTTSIIGKTRNQF